MGPYLTLAIAACAGCVVAKFVLSLRAQVLDRALKKERALCRNAKKARDEAKEAATKLTREKGKLERKQASLEKGLYELAKQLESLDREAQAAENAA